jgi:hypothetical protein
MTEDATKNPKTGGQNIVNNDGWLGSEGGMFGSVEKTKTWTSTKVDDDSAAAPRHLNNSNNDFLGGSSPGKSNSPKPIKIEGARSSFKDNPFLKNKPVH